MNQTPVLEIKGIHKYFPGVHALNGVDFDLLPGEVHALVGENGAGKSTLIKILSGVHEYSAGEYRIEGAPANVTNTMSAIAKGISVVYQELNLVDTLSIAENIFFGRLPNVRGRVQWKKLYQDTREYLERVGLKVNPRTKVQHLSIAQQQLVEIAKAISLNAKVIIMDEPTSALSPKEIEGLFRIIHDLTKQRISVIYVSHKLEEIFEIADRITVLRDGSSIGTYEKQELTQQLLIEKMVGRKMNDMFPERQGKIGKVVLEVSHLSTDNVHDLSFTVREGEIVGFSGLMGAGRTEMTMALYGADKRLGGDVTFCGQKIPKNSPNAARKAGIGMVVENRKEFGLLPNLSVRKNMTVVSLNQFLKGVHISRGQENAGVQDMLEKLKIKTPSMEQQIPKLSGGNQQKVLLARWLMKENLKLMVIDEPTRGIDVGAKAEIYQIIHDLAANGLAILMVSSELTEIMGMCDRIYVMKNGRISGEFLREEATETALLEKAISAGNR